MWFKLLAQTRQAGIARIQAGETRGIMPRQFNAEGRANRTRRTGDEYLSAGDGFPSGMAGFAHIPNLAQPFCGPLEGTSNR